MSKHSESSSRKVCVTCEHWYGPREIDGQQRHALYDGSKGKCLGKHKNNTRNPTESCSGWTKWGLLK